MMHRNKKTYRLFYLPTGRAERVMTNDGLAYIEVKAHSDRAAKLAFTKLKGYINWSLYMVSEIDSYL